MREYIFHYKGGHSVRVESLSPIIRMFAPCHKKSVTTLGRVVCLLSLKGYNPLQTNYHFEGGIKYMRVHRMLFCDYSHLLTSLT